MILTDAILGERNAMQPDTCTGTLAADATALQTEVRLPSLVAIRLVSGPRPEGHFSRQSRSFDCCPNPVFEFLKRLVLLQRGDKDSLLRNNFDWCRYNFCLLTGELTRRSSVNLLKNLAIVVHSLHAWL